eukprot:COSAG01_NODE_3234_length_6375_cov_3.436036_5_plen_230_part_00
MAISSKKASAGVWRWLLHALMLSLAPARPMANAASRSSPSLGRAAERAQWQQSSAALMRLTPPSLSRSSSPHYSYQDHGTLMMVLFSAVVPVMSSALGMPVQATAPAAAPAPPPPPPPLRVAATPPMGYNSYDSYDWTMNETQLFRSAEALQRRLLPSGYDTITLDCEWSLAPAAPALWLPASCWTPTRRICMSNHTTARRVLVPRWATDIAHSAEGRATHQQLLSNLL